jgi:hypothetical protein
MKLYSPSSRQTCRDLLQHESMWINQCPLWHPHLQQSWLFRPHPVHFQVHRMRWYLWPLLLRLLWLLFCGWTAKGWTNGAVLVNDNVHAEVMCTFTTRLRMWAKHRTRARDPWNPSRRSPNSSTSVLSFDALSAVNARICGHRVSLQTLHRIAHALCHGYHIHVNIRKFEQPSNCRCVPWML